MKKKTTFYWVFAALLLAISVVLKVYLGIPVSFLGNLAKDINLSPAIIMLCGITMGPFMGGLVGGLTDIVATLIRPMGAYVPWFTLTNILIGVIPALFYRKKDVKEYKFGKCLLVSVVEQTVCSALLNNILLISLYGFPIEVAFFRAIGSYISAALYAALLYLLLNRTKSIFDKIK